MAPRHANPRESARALPPLPPPSLTNIPPATRRPTPQRARRQHHAAGQTRGEVRPPPSPARRRNHPTHRAPRPSTTFPPPRPP
jgi:hypothetical protein